MDHYREQKIEKLKKLLQSPKGRRKIYKELSEIVDILIASYEDWPKSLGQDKKYIRQILENWNSKKAREELYHWVVLLKWVLEIKTKELELIIEDLEKYITLFNIYQ